MTTLTKRMPLTQRQQIALSRVRAAVNQNMITTLSYLEGEDNSPWLLQQIVSYCVKKGNVKSLQILASSKFTIQISKKKYFECAKNAFRNLEPVEAKYAYEMAKVPLPEKKFQKMANSIIANVKKDSDWHLAAKIYACIDMLPPEYLLRKMQPLFKQNYCVYAYTESCLILNEKSDHRFLTEALAYWMKDPDVEVIDYLTQTLGIRLSKKTLIELAEKAYAKNKIIVGDDFIDMAFAEKKR